MKARPIIRIATAVAISTVAIILAAATADAGPPEAVFDGNDQTWFCTSDGFPAPPTHCLNTRSQGTTGLIMVFPPDDRGPAEGISGPNAADRPCPHDPGAVDGTWWEVMPDTYVCHRKP